MNQKFLNRIGVAIGVVAIAVLLLFKVNGQQNTKPGVMHVSTNWVGYLVIGKEDTNDRISPGPSPHCEGQVQIGLRSDGVVVWRRAFGP
jgi:hypothetical protein